MARDLESLSFSELREWSRERDKAAKHAETEVKELTAYRAEILGQRREKAVAAAFEEAGLNPKHAALYLDLNEDVDPADIQASDVQAFAKENGLVDVETPDIPRQESGGYTPFTTSIGAELGPISLDEALRLPPDEANKLFQRGRVERLPRDPDTGELKIDWLGESNE